MANIGYWPPNIPRQETLDAFVRAYETCDYVECADGAQEPGFEKIAVYAKREPNGDLIPTHAALQLPDGRWTSKLGPFEDVDHTTLDVLNSPAYGAAVRFLKKPT